MSLTVCPECGKEISDRAAACPGCGYTPKKRGYWSGCLSFIVLLIVSGIALQYFDGKNGSRYDGFNPKAFEQSRKERIQKSFTWNGSHRGLEQWIKKAMNDPDSFKHVETTYSDNGDHLIVKTSFRGKNKFGGTVTNWVKARTDLDGNVLAIIEEDR